MPSWLNEAQMIGTITKFLVSASCTMHCSSCANTRRDLIGHATLWPWNEEGEGLLEGKRTHHSAMCQAQRASQNGSQGHANWQILEARSHDPTRMGARRRNGLYSWPWVAGMILYSLTSECWIWQGRLAQTSLILRGFSGKQTQRKRWSR